MKYYIIAGEASGDLHGSNLIKSIKMADPQAIFRAWGGDLMEEEGAELVKHYRETAYMGIFEVLANFRKIAHHFDLCHKDILAWQPDVVILIDYPGFNLRIARFVKEHQIRVFYYISPKVWVWKESRVEIIKKYVDKMFVIFPFEKAFYAKHNYEVEYYGNPLIDAIEERKINVCSKSEFFLQHSLSDKPLIALLPGSRKQEVSRLLPIFLKLVQNFPDYQFVVAGTNTLGSRYYHQFIQQSKAAVVFNQTYELLNFSSAAVVASGTATLETALFNLPQVVCYRIFPATYAIGRLFVHVKYFSLVNIIMEREIVKELLQHHLVKDISAELDKLLNDSSYKNEMIQNYKQLRELCGGSGASKRVGENMVKLLKA